VVGVNMRAFFHSPFITGIGKICHLLMTRKERKVKMQKRKRKKKIGLFCCSKRQQLIWREYRN
jgi:hypothetical protein